MKILFRKKNILFFLFATFSTCYVNAQNQNVTVNQDPKFEQLLNEKRKINSSLTVGDSYKIQVFTGSSENAKKILTEFRQEFNNIDATIVFNTPNYKVWVGNFRTRIEAEKTYINISDRYKNVLLIKPSR